MQDDEELIGHTPADSKEAHDKSTLCVGSNSLFAPTATLQEGHGAESNESTWGFNKYESFDEEAVTEKLQGGLKLGNNREVVNSSSDYVVHSNKKSNPVNRLPDASPDDVQRLSQSNPLGILRPPTESNPVSHEILPDGLLHTSHVVDPDFLGSSFSTYSSPVEHEQPLYSSALTLASMSPNIRKNGPEPHAHRECSSSHNSPEKTPAEVRTNEDLMKEQNLNACPRAFLLDDSLATHMKVERETDSLKARVPYTSLEKSTNVGDNNLHSVFSSMSPRSHEQLGDQGIQSDPHRGSPRFPLHRSPVHHITQLPDSSASTVLLWRSATSFEVPSSVVQRQQLHANSVNELVLDSDENKENKKTPGSTITPDHITHGIYHMNRDNSANHVPKDNLRHPIQFCAGRHYSTDTCHSHKKSYSRDLNQNVSQCFETFSSTTPHMLFDNVLDNPVDGRPFQQFVNGVLQYGEHSDTAIDSNYEDSWDDPHVSHGHPPTEIFSLGDIRQADLLVQQGYSLQDVFKMFNSNSSPKANTQQPDCSLNHQAYVSDLTGSMLSADKDEDVNGSAFLNTIFKEHWPKHFWEINGNSTLASQPLRETTLQAGLPIQYGVHETEVQRRFQELTLTGAPTKNLHYPQQKNTSRFPCNQTNMDAHWHQQGTPQIMEAGMHRFINCWSEGGHSRPKETALLSAGDMVQMSENKKWKKEDENRDVNLCFQREEGPIHVKPTNVMLDNSFEKPSDSYYRGYLNTTPVAFKDSVSLSPPQSVSTSRIHDNDVFRLPSSIEEQQKEQNHQRSLLQQMRQQQEACQQKLYKQDIVQQEQKSPFRSTEQHQDASELQLHVLRTLLERCKINQNQRQKHSSPYSGGKTHESYPTTKSGFAASNALLRLIRKNNDPSPNDNINKDRGGFGSDPRRDTPSVGYFGACSEFNQQYQDDLKLQLPQRRFPLERLQQAQKNDGFSSIIGPMSYFLSGQKRASHSATYETSYSTYPTSYEGAIHSMQHTTSSCARTNPGTQTENLRASPFYEAQVFNQHEKRLPTTFNEQEEPGIMQFAPTSNYLAEMGTQPGLFPYARNGMSNPMMLDSASQVSQRKILHVKTDTPNATAHGFYMKHSIVDNVTPSKGPTRTDSSDPVLKLYGKQPFFSRDSDEPDLTKYEKHTQCYALDSQSEERSGFNVNASVFVPRAHMSPIASYPVHEIFNDDPNPSLVDISLQSTTSGGADTSASTKNPRVLETPRFYDKYFAMMPPNVLTTSNIIAPNTSTQSSRFNLGHNDHSTIEPPKGSAIAGNEPYL